jgi:hypothetical protein
MTLDYDYGLCDWPTLEEVRRVLDVDPNSNAWDTTLERVRLSAIQQVKNDVGDWDEMLDTPTCKLAQAALRMAELLSLRPEGAAVANQDPTYRRLMSGQIRRFAIS